MKNKDLLKIIDLLKSPDNETVELGVKLFKQSSFMKQFRGNLSCLAFIFYYNRSLNYVHYKDLYSYIKVFPNVLSIFANNKYKAFLVIKNNKLV
jgi:hypothetical protein